MITYTSIAEEILKRLYSTGVVRSSELTKGLKYSKSPVYQTLKELEKAGLIQVATNRPRFKEYVITQKGKELISEEFRKSYSEIFKLVRESPYSYDLTLELLSEQVLQSLPENLRSFSIIPLIKEKIRKNIENIKEELKKGLPAIL